MNIKALQDYIKYCQAKEIECTWQGLKAFYQLHKELYRIA